jgi:hypothetical protein
MRQVGADRHGARLRALIVVLWRGGLPIQEALISAQPRVAQPATVRA